MLKVNSRSLGETFEEWAYRYHKQRWGVCVRWKTKYTQSLFGDFSYYKAHNCVRATDAKVEQLETPYFPVEIWQDKPSGDRGWFQDLVQCREIFYAQCRAVSRCEVDFKKVVRIDLDRMREYVSVEGERLSKVVTKKGYGETHLKLVPISDMVRKRIAVSEKLEFEQFMAIYKGEK